MKFHKLPDSTASLSTPNAFGSEPLNNDLFNPILKGIDWAIETLFQFLIQGKEPQIQMTQKPDGSTLWRVYDPQTRDHAVFETEGEVRSWLEERYYR